jgi:DNA-binding GntR family transcriptional regulator
MLKLSLPENLYFGTKTDYVVEAIRTAILVGDLLPGTRITEQQIRDLLKVSSSPVREAFHQLEAEGLLTRNPHIGTKVTQMDIGDAKELYLIQSLLQGTAVQISTKKLKEEDILEVEKLNQEMKKMCGKGIDVKGLRVVNYKLHMILCGVNVYPWLTRLISALWVRFPTQSLWLMPDRPKNSVQQHEKIIRAVKKKDEILAGSLMRKHLESSRRALYG